MARLGKINIRGEPISGFLLVFKVRSGKRLLRMKILVSHGTVELLLGEMMLYVEKVNVPNWRSLVQQEWEERIIYYESAKFCSSIGIEVRIEYTENIVWSLEDHSPK
jgi:hypothetical protein